MKLQVLVATMNQVSARALIKSMELDKDAIIINQLTASDSVLEKIEKDKQFYSYKEKGLSRSRNRAISLSRADICAIADDDMYYEDDYEQTILNGYKKYQDADIIAFIVDYDDKNIIKNPIKEGRVNLIYSMRLSSVQITFKRKSIIDNSIKFNNNFGAGTYNYMGEENIFLADCLKSGLKIYYVPEKIANLRISTSSWFNGYDERYFKVKGSIFYRMSRLLCPIFIIQFAIRKRHIFSDSVNLFNAVKYMFQGIVSERNEKN